MMGPAGGQRHLELTVGTRDAVRPSRSPEDLLVIYLAGRVSDDLIACAVIHGGTVVPAHNPYWDVGGITIADPDGYRLVLTQVSWGRNTPLPSWPRVLGAPDPGFLGPQHSAAVLAPRTGRAWSRVLGAATLHCRPSPAYWARASGRLDMRIRQGPRRAAPGSRPNMT